MTTSETAHQNDPCKFCGTAHDDVAIGDCPNNPPAPNRRHFRMLVGSFADVPGAWRGDAYCYHPHGVIRHNIIFTDHHNVNDYCDARVILEPEHGIVGASYGRSASIGGPRGDAIPRPKQGGTVCVYSNGAWVGPWGPWRKLICDTLSDLEKEIAAIKQKKVDEEEAERIAREAAREALYAKAAQVTATT